MLHKILQLIMWKKVGLKAAVKVFSVDFNPIDTNDILDIHEYLMKRTWYKIMFGLIKEIFIGLMTGLVNGSNHTTCVSLSNQKYMIHPGLINLHPNKYSQEFHYYPFYYISNTLNDLCSKQNRSFKSKSVQHYYRNKWIKNIKKAYANVTVDLMEKKVIQINGGIMINVDVNVKNVMYVKKIMDDSVIICNEFIELYEETKTIPTNFNEKKAVCKTRNFYILLTVF